MFYLSKPLTCGLGTKLLGTSLLMLSSLKDPPNPGTVEVKLLIPKQKVKALVSCQKSTRQTMIWIWKMSLAPTCPFRQPLTHFVKWQFSMNNIYSPFYSGNSHFPWIWQKLLIQLRPMQVYKPSCILQSYVSQGNIQIRIFFLIVGFEFGSILEED